MPDQRWIYSSPSWNTKGVTLTENSLEWWESGQSFAGGGSCEQSLEDFLQNGQPVDEVPADVVAEITAAIRLRISEADVSPNP